MIYQNNWLDPNSVEGSTREQRQSSLHVDFHLNQDVHQFRAPGSSGKQEKQDFTDLDHIDTLQSHGNGGDGQEFHQLQQLDSENTASKHQQYSSSVIIK